MKAPETREAVQPLCADPWLEPAAWNCDRVRARTIALVGNGGHHALLQRSLAQVRDEFPWLSEVRAEDGYLTGLTTVLPEQSCADRKSACAAVRRQYVQLLLAFLGEGLTRKLVSDDWPELLPSRGEVLPEIASGVAPLAPSAL